MYLVVSRCILMYLDGTHQNTCKIHAGYIQDTSGYVLYRKHPPICIGNPPSPVLHAPVLQSVEVCERGVQLQDSRDVVARSETESSLESV